MEIGTLRVLPANSRGHLLAARQALHHELVLHHQHIAHRAHLEPIPLQQAVIEALRVQQLPADIAEVLHHRHGVDPHQEDLADHTAEEVEAAVADLATPSHTWTFHDLSILQK